MKNLFLFICILSLTLVACKDDDGPSVNGDYLRYDGENVSAPELVAGTHEFAARFPPSKTSSFQGKNLTEVEWVNGPSPQSAELRIYGEGSASEPGVMLYSANITNTFNWDGSNPETNRHTLATPIPIGDTDIWIAIRVVHAVAQQSLGCDALGSRQNDGDWLYSSTDNQWRTFQDRTSDGINWNIRGIVGE